MDWIYTLTGLLVGLLVGLTGVGGGSLMTPLLIFAFGIAPSVAVGTDLLYAAATKLGGMWSHARQRTVEWKVVLLLGAGSLPGAWLTTRYLKDMRSANGEVETLITTVLGIALIVTSLTLLFRSRLKGWRAEHGNGARLRAGVTVLTGAVLGTLVAFTSIGAGALGAAALSLLYPRLPSIRIIGTDIAHAVPMAALAGWARWTSGCWPACCSARCPVCIWARAWA